MEYARLEQEIALLRVQQERIMEKLGGAKKTSDYHTHDRNKFKNEYGMTLKEAILAALKKSKRPQMPREFNIPEEMAKKNSVHPALASLVKQGKVVRVTEGYKLAS